MNAQIVLNELGIQSSSNTAKKNVQVRKDDPTFGQALKKASADKQVDSDPKDKKTYNQVVNNSRASIVKKQGNVQDTTETKGAVEVKNGAKEEVVTEDVKAASESVLEGIATLLGIDSDDLKKLMAENNMSTEDLLDSTKLDQFVEQISLNLELNTQQKQVLLSAAQQFSKLANASISKDNQANTNQNMVVVEDVPIEVVAKDSQAGKLVHLDKDIKDLAKSIKSDAGPLFDDVPTKFESLLKQFSINPKNTKTAEVKEEIKHESDDKKVSNEEDSTVTKTVATSKETVKTSENQLSNTLGSAKDNEIPLSQSHSNTQQIQKDDFVSKLHNISSQTKVVRNELMKQVVEQAKVVIDENKSEMVMQLRPESLGKLTLKIVTENGIVAAKFMAESQQVKEVLDTNMQLLKDSLEKQGMSIQSVSVSVGQEGSQNSGQHEAFQRKGKRNLGLTNESTAFVTGIDEESIAKSNPYEESSNSIDIVV